MMNFKKNIKVLFLAVVVFFMVLGLAIGKMKIANAERIETKTVPVINMTHMYDTDTYEVTVLNDNEEVTISVTESVYTDIIEHNDFTVDIIISGDIIDIL